MLADRDLIIVVAPFGQPNDRMLAAAERAGAWGAVRTAKGLALLGTDRVLAEVTSTDEAVTAVAAGAEGLVAKGWEAGGRVGDLTTFVLLQQLLAADLGRPIWAAGGIGPATAAAA